MHKFLVFPFLIAMLTYCSPKENPLAGNEFSADSVVRYFNYIYQKSPDEGIGAVREYLFSGKELTDSIVFFDVMQQYAIMMGQNGNLDSAMYYFEKAQSFTEKQQGEKAKLSYAKALYNMSFILINMGKTDEAINKLRISDSIFSVFNDYKTSIYANMLMSTAHVYNENFIEALENIEKCITICDQKKDSSLMISALQAYADLFVTCHFFDEALEQFHRTEAYKDHFNKNSLFAHYSGKGRMFYLQGNNEQAKDEYLKAYHTLSTNDVFDSLLVSLNIAETYLNLGKTDSAYVYLELVSRYPVYLEHALMFKFGYYSLLGDFYTRKSLFLDAEKAFNIAETCSSGIDKTLIKLHLKRKADYYKSVGDYKKAFATISEYNQMQEGILRANNRMHIAGLQYKYERDTTVISQRSQLALNDEKLKKYQLLHAMLIFSVLFFVILAVFVYVVNKKNKKIERERNMRKMASLKMENVKGQLSPHFTFNVLNNIWAIIDDRDLAKDKFGKLMAMIRSSLINSEKVSISLKDEIEFVESFIDLQNLRTGEGISVKWEIDQKIDLGIQVPGMVLQIPVENAIKHGLLPKNGEKNLKIEIKSCNEYLHLHIEDNGLGFKPGSSVNKGTGTGIKVLTNTMHTLNQVNSKKMTYQVLDLTRQDCVGTKVSIKIPFDYNYNLN